MADDPIRVMVVDDEPDSAELVRAMLQRKGGMEAVVAGDAAAALQCLRSERFDLLVTDIELPGMSGLDLIGEVRRRAPGTPVIVVTAYGSVDYAVTALREHADEFLVKPVDSDRLVERARELVAAARRRAAAGAPTRVLAIGAHPDDVELGVGATLGAHHAVGDPITVLTLSGGAVGGQPSDRLREAFAAADVVDARLVVRDFEDTRLGPVAALVSAIEDVVAEVRPSVVYTHSAHDRHQDHRAVHEATEIAARRVPTFACFQSPSATIDFRPARFVPVDDFVETKVRMLGAFASQAHRDYMQPDLVRATARYWSRYGTTAYAEPLEVLRSGGAAALRGHRPAGHDEGTGEDV